MTADLEALYSERTGVSDDDRLLANALRDRGANELASYASGDEIVRRFHHGLASGLTKQEARSMLKAMVEVVRGRRVEDIDAWISRQWKESHDDPRWTKVSKLFSEQRQGSD